METILKTQIQQALAAYCRQAGSQQKAARTLRGVSGATISQILNGRHEAVTEQMWRSIAAQIGHDSDAWAMVETRPYLRLTGILDDARCNSLVLGVTGDAGCGKTAAVRVYAAAHPHVIRLCCSEYWNRRKFLAELSRGTGVACTGATLAEMMDDVIHHLLRLEKPLIVLDEADKLTDQVLGFFITLYNALEGKCGVVLCATDFLEKRIRRGVTLNKKGYREIFSRLGRRLIPLQVVNADDVAAVCAANGVDDPARIGRIADDCEHDLRRVKRLIHALRQKPA